MIGEHEVAVLSLAIENVRTIECSRKHRHCQNVGRWQELPQPTMAGLLAQRVDLLWFAEAVRTARRSATWRSDLDEVIEELDRRQNPNRQHLRFPPDDALARLLGLPSCRGGSDHGGCVVASHSRCQDDAPGAPVWSFRRIY